MVNTRKPNRGRLLFPSPGAATTGHPEALYAHNQKTPERSNRQRSKHLLEGGVERTPPTQPNSPEEQEDPADRSGVRPIGRLRPHRLNLFANANSNTTNSTSNTQQPQQQQQQRATHSNANVNSGPSRRAHKLAQNQQQQKKGTAAQSAQPQQDLQRTTPAAASKGKAPKSSNVIPETHVNVITQAYGPQADIYSDVLQIPRDMASDRDIRIAYFRRGRQVLAEKPSTNASMPVTVTNVTQWAKLKFQAVSMAYEILSNPTWKESYRKYGLHGPGSSSSSFISQEELPGDSLMEGDDYQGDNVAERDVHHRHQEQHQQHSNNNSNKSHRPPKKPILSHTPSTLPAENNSELANNNPSNNRVTMDADNASQSTAGTGTSSVLRKAGTFLEKCKLKHKNAQFQGFWSSDNTHNMAAQASSVRWNEEVEELIFRQDPEEVSFKARGLEEEDYNYDEDEGEPEENAYNCLLDDDENGGNTYCADDANDNSSNKANNSAYQYRQEQQVLTQGQGQQARGYPPQCAVKNPDHHGNATAARNNVGDEATTTMGGGKQKKRIVLDTAELGSHLEKLDKVADSIAGIFDELEASFDGILGMGNRQQQQQQQQGRQQYQNLNNNGRIAQAPERALSPVEGDSELAVPPQARSSYHTPHRVEASNLQLQEQHQKQQFMFPKGQEMGFQDKSSAPPSDVVVKNKSKKHVLQVEGASDLALLAEHGQQQLALEREGLSLCDTDLATFAETATVGTSISLLDPQKYSQTALKPAASTSTIAKAQRKRLRNVQRRRQQQQLLAQQQQERATAEEQQQEFQGDHNRNPKNNDGDRGGFEDKQTHCKKADSYARPPDMDKKSKKKGEDAYFENLYNNFFALPKERLPNEMTIQTKPPRSTCSVSTISHSVATAPDSGVNLDFNPWDFANSAWPALGEEQEQTKRNKDTLDRLDSMAAQRSSNTDFSFDSSFPESFGLNTTMDSGTAVDTSFDSSAVDSGLTSAVIPRDERIAAARANGCNDAAEFLNHVFDVPLEAPLEFWCGDADNCAASTDASMRERKKILQQHRRRHLNKRFNRKDSISTTDDTSIAASSIQDVEDEQSEPATEESVTLMDPPTHDSRILNTLDHDDSTMASFNTSHQQEDTDEHEVRIDKDDKESPESGSASQQQSNVASSYTEASASNDVAHRSRSPSPAQGETKQEESTDQHDESEADQLEFTEQDIDEEGEGQNTYEEHPLPDVDVETASDSQFLEIDKPSPDNKASSVVHVETASIATEIEADNNEDREDISCVTMEVLSAKYQFVSGHNFDKFGTMNDEDISPAASSFSSQRGGMDSVATSWDEEQDLADEYYYAGDVGSVATSVSSAVSRSKANESSFINYLMTYLQKAIKANAEMSSLACIQSHLNSGLESWKATNHACMDAIIISDEDMAGMLDVLEHEMQRPTPDFGVTSSE